MAPGFLIGGRRKNFGISACLGETPFFVIEAGRIRHGFLRQAPKFVHHQPRTAVLNNLELIIRTFSSILLPSRRNSIILCALCRVPG